MRAWLTRWLVRLAVLLVVVLATFLGTRAWYSRLLPPLEPWHMVVPGEPDAREIARLDWAGWLAAEERVRAEVDRLVVRDGTPDGPPPLDRYLRSSPIWPGRLEADWNRSYLLEPGGEPRGAVVLLHGLTDSPYSLRHVARLYRDRGWLAIGLRLPGHGTVPAGLTLATVEDWTAATRMAARAARARIGPDRPLHLVGFSNGGALALQYALDALEDPALAPPDRLVLLTPMVGITEFARLAGIAGWPALLPAFAEAAWLAVLPEFNPFKYNSFPVNGAVQSHRLTQILQGQLRRLAAAGRLADLAPVLTIQSAVDFTVSARTIVEGLYGLLPPGARPAAARAATQLAVGRGDQRRARGPARGGADRQARRARGAAPAARHRLAARAALPEPRGAPLPARRRAARSASS